MRFRQTHSASYATRCKSRSRKVAIHLFAWQAADELNGSVGEGDAKTIVADSNAVKVVEAAEFLQVGKVFEVGGLLGTFDGLGDAVQKALVLDLLQVTQKLDRKVTCMWTLAEF